jgi:hypothetical protein
LAGRSAIVVAGFRLVAELGGGVNQSEENMSTVPYVIRWRNAVMDDPNPTLTWRALVAACALIRYATATTGRDCYPGAQRCADDMRVSVDTIQRGWNELEAAGWIRLHPLPEKRRRSQGALKELRWPAHAVDADSGHVETTYSLTADVPPADSGPTIPGNQKSSGSPSGRPGEPGQDGGSPVRTAAAAPPPRPTPRRALCESPGCEKSADTFYVGLPQLCREHERERKDAEIVARYSGTSDAELLEALRQARVREDLSRSMDLRKALEARGLPVPAWV